MVCLTAYRCNNCSSICERSDDFHVGICIECGKLTCGLCRTLFNREAHRAAKCAITHKNCKYTSLCTTFITFLHKFPPDDELKLLNYGRWCPIRCLPNCTSSLAVEQIGHVDTSIMCCTKCYSDDEVVKKPSFDAYMKIVDELRDYFSDCDYIHATRDHMQLSHLKCDKCKASLRYPEYLTATGALACRKCKDELGNSHTANKGNLSMFLSLLLYIPAIGDLKRLTYSKWTPLRCELCSTLFSTYFLQLPMFHPNCSQLLCNKCTWNHPCSKPSSFALQLKWVLDVDQEFRSYFKNGGKNLSEIHIKNSDFTENVLDLMPRPSSNHSEQRIAAISEFPKEVRCQGCARMEAPSNIRMCNDCKKSSLCFACLTKKHWGHNIEEIASTLETAFIQKESEKTLQKMAKWKESVTEGSRQIDAVNMRVVDNYNWLYKVAIRENDLAILQAIREWGDIEQLKGSTDNLIGSQIKFRSDAEVLADALDVIVNSAKERYGESEIVTDATASTSKGTTDNNCVID